jgi:hypothetical protein
MGLIMVLIYIISGTLLLIFKLHTSIDDQTRIMVGIMLIVYGIYRAWRAYLKLKMNSDTID